MSDTDVILSRDISRDQLLAELRALRPRFEQAGVTHMALFGSRARGDNRLDSDVDLAIDVDPDRKFSLIDLSGVALLVEDTIALEGNIFMRRSLAADFLAEVHGDGVEVF